MKFNNFLASFCVFYVFNCHASNTPISFVNKDSSLVKLTPKKNLVNVQIEFRGQLKSEIVTVETEQDAKVSIDDYNFDGFKDFSVRHLDDGKGTYTIHRIFIYAPGKGKFNEIFPACSDEFINVRLNKTKKLIISSYLKESTWAICQTKF
ncbi:MAG: hypothetical protein K2Y28_07330 [Burkholderiaceae bacterium]|nr:hypothetical protein [Burkholderiaceae bacterium]